MIWADGICDNSAYGCSDDCDINHNHHNKNSEGGICDDEEYERHESDGI